MELIYARCLDWAVRIALGVLGASFALYASGIFDPLVPVQGLSRLWTLPVDRFIAATGAPTGWGWLRHLARGDYLNLVGVALLGLVTVLGYARIVPVMLEARERLYAGLALAQIVVLLAAASGLFTQAH